MLLFLCLYNLKYFFVSNSQKREIMVQTESLLKLRGMTSETRNKTSSKVQPFAQKRTSDAFPHHFRTNQIVIQAQLPNVANTQRFKVPAFNSLISSMWIQVRMPSCNSGNYRPSAILDYVKEVRLKHSDTFFTYQPKRLMPILLNRDRNKISKDKKLAIFGPRLAANGEVEWLLPIIHPWDQWLSKDFYENDVKYGVRSKGLFRCDLLKEELVVELDLAPLPDYSQDGAAVAAGDNPYDLRLFFEELLSPNIEQIKKALPTTTVSNVYTHMENQTNDGTATVYKISSIMSRAPTENLILFVKPNSDSGKDPFKYDGTVAHYKVTCDGRVIIDNEELNSAAAQKYQRLREGATDGRGDPTLPVISFGPHGYGVAHTTGIISNTACNTTELEIKCNAASVVCITAEHCQNFAFKSGTVQYSNAY
jgi:hypothetical protein